MPGAGGGDRNWIAAKRDRDMNKKRFKQAILFPSSSVPVYVGWARHKTSEGFPLAYHPEYEFHYIKRGQGAYYIEGRTWCFATRHLVIIRPNQIHSLIPNADNWVEKVQILFKGEWLGAFLSALNIDKTFPTLICLPDSAAVHIEMILNRILEENARREQGWEEMVCELLHEFLLWVKRLKNQPVSPQAEKPLFVQVRKYMELHFADPQCNVTRIARQFDYSLNYLSALFKTASGLGIKQYLLQYRIIAARQILDENPGLKIEAIARQVGFNNYRSFTRAFIALTGIAPADYRKKCHIHR